jgi:hypothetical protein
MGRRFKAGGEIGHPLQPMIRKGAQDNVCICKETSRTISAGSGDDAWHSPDGCRATRLLPAEASQLGALSASLAGIILAAVEGRKGGVRELLGRSLIWRVGIQWWAFVLLFPIIPSVAALYLFNLFGGPAVDWSGLKPLSSVVPMISCSQSSPGWARSLAGEDLRCPAFKPAITHWCRA